MSWGGIMKAMLEKYIEQAKAYICVHSYPNTAFAEDAIAMFERDLQELKSKKNKSKNNEKNESSL